MSVTQLYLVRHGETTWNAEGRVQGHSESMLSASGIAQAAERSDEMLQHRFDAAYCSSSQRTRQTVHGLLDGAVDHVRYRDDLREIMLGSWEGRLRKDLQEEHAELYEKYFHRPAEFELEGAENYAQLQQRGEDALTEIVEVHAGQRVLVVSHGAIIKATLLRFLGWPLSQMWVEPLIGNCSCSVVEHSPEDGFKVLSIADNHEY